MNHQHLFAIMSGQDRSAKAHLVRTGLTCLEPFYRAATTARNKLFDWNIRKPKRLPRPTISVGNITTGGTGKTPMVIALAKKLRAMGEKPAVLLRGYGDDETIELRDALNQPADGDKHQRVRKVSVHVPRDDSIAVLEEHVDVR